MCNTKLPWWLWDAFLEKQINQNQIFHDTLCIRSKRVTIGRGYLQVIVPTGNIAPLEEMLQWWRAIGNTVSIWRARGLNLRPPALETNALPLDQLAGYCNLMWYLRIQCARLGECLHWVAWTYPRFILPAAVQSHEAEIIIVKRLIHGRNNMAQGAGWTNIIQSRSWFIRRLYPLSPAAD